MDSVMGHLRKDEMIEMISLHMKGMELTRDSWWEGDQRGYIWGGGRGGVSMWSEIEGNNAI